MTFYEELGVPADATTDTIHEAYRNVARLLHSDAQTNPVLKESAEVQMKRINRLYGILSDPERRRNYDHELAEQSDRPGRIIIQAAPWTDQFRRTKRGTYVWLAATAVCATFIIWLAARETSSPAVYPQSSSRLSEGVQTLLSPPTPARKSAIMPKTNADRQRDDEIARLRAELAAAKADRERLVKQIAAMQSEHKWQPPPSEAGQPAHVASPANLAPAPLAAPATLEVSLPAVSLSPAIPPAMQRTGPPSMVEARVSVREVSKANWTGSWAYSHPRTESRDRGLFPPEFIETVISEDNGHLRGQYRARFKVADAGISPEVNFHFEGKVSGMSGRFPWTGTGGAKGEVEIRWISNTALEVVWGATSLGKSMGLASGTAILNRKN